ncbi:hypothetical protein B0H10DRAFT_1769364, partial [Mycena sp. CBHHK59/15]
PVEIWANVFSHTCLDDGSMGRTLSLVSRYVRNASRHVKFQAITINSLTDLTAFVGILESTPPHLRRVRFLTV